MTHDSTYGEDIFLSCLTWLTSLCMSDVNKHIMKNKKTGKKAGKIVILKKELVLEICQNLLRYWSFQEFKSLGHNNSRSMSNIFCCTLGRGEGICPPMHKLVKEWFRTKMVYILLKIFISCKKNTTAIDNNNILLI